MPTSLQQAYSSSSGYKNRVQFTADGTFTVPAGVYVLKEIWGTGGGGAGGGVDGNTTSKAQGCGGGSAASTVIARDIAVRPGDIITIKVGQKGLGVVGQAGQNGTDTIVYRNFIPILKAKGGVGGTVGSAAGIGGVNSIPDVAAINNHVAALNATIGFIGGDGANGASSLTGISGKIVRVVPVNLGTTDEMFPSFPITVSNAGSSNGTIYGGGGGGCSVYGQGGQGGTPAMVVNDAVRGGDATNRGSGGGGSSGGTTNVRGGHGQDGIVEFYY